MKIGIMANCLIAKNKTGIATYLHNVLKWMAANDSENEYILYHWQPFEETPDYGKNFRTELVPGTKGWMWLFWTMPQKLRKDKPQVIWGPAHEIPGPVWGVRSVLTVHDLALAINPDWGIKSVARVINLYLPIMTRYAHKILADSQSTKEDLVRIMKVREDRISTVYLGGYEDQTHLVSAQGLAAAKQKYGIEDKYFFFVGTIEPRKNIDTMIAAFEILAARDPQIQLVLAGGVGWSCEDVLEQMKKSPYAQRILQIGFVEKQEKMDLYAGAQAFLFPSHYEGFGLPVLEAMSLGGIVITANNSSLPEVGGEAALYVENENDVGELAERMTQVLAMDSEQRQSRIAMGIAQAAKFSWEKCAKETAEEILGKELSI